MNRRRFGLPKRQLFMMIGWIFGIIIFSGCLVYLLRWLEAFFERPLEEFALLAYGIVFVATLVGAATIIFPLPATPIVLAAAAKWDPNIVALVASVGVVLGELVGYCAGHLGRKAIIKEGGERFEKVVALVNKYGVWAVAFIALVPIVLFDIVGLAAGALKLPVWKFALAAWAGRLPRAFLEVYLGAAFLQFILFRE